MPSAHTAYVLSSSIAFVPHPHLQQCWPRVHACVLYVDCEFCGAKAGELCRTPGRKREAVASFTHVKRRYALKAKMKDRGAAVRAPRREDGGLKFVEDTVRYSLHRCQPGTFNSALVDDRASRA